MRVQMRYRACYGPLRCGSETFTTLIHISS